MHNTNFDFYATIRKYKTSKQFESSKGTPIEILCTISLLKQKDKKEKDKQWNAAQGSNPGP